MCWWFLVIKAANKKISECKSSEPDETFPKVRTICAQVSASDLSGRRTYKALVVAVFISLTYVLRYMGAKIIWSRYMNVHAGYRKAQNGSPGTSNSYWRVAIATRQIGHTWGMNASSPGTEAVSVSLPAHKAWLPGGLETGSMAVCIRRGSELTSATSQTLKPTASTSLKSNLFLSKRKM